MTVVSTAGTTALATIVSARREQLAQRWADLTFFRTVHVAGRDAAVDAARRLADGLAEAASDGRIGDLRAPAFDRIRPLLAQMISDRARSGCSSLQISAEMAELGDPLLPIAEGEPGGDGHGAVLAAMELMGSIRILGMDISLSEEGEVIARQRQQLLEVATPVLKLWDGVVGVPLIGTLDSARTQVVMETLLEAIADQQATVAILDITGVPLVDTVVAQHLMKTVMAVRLMGAKCVVSGIRPQIAQTVVELGIDLGDIVTRATLADALGWALAEVGTKVVARA